ncbi:SCO7613 C-terminal domain-containing membrane protein [Planotetraspora sp. GP83]|uniref:SCO7613 C-terminal domain-containing membrane protein n=1 Tax=Planotetraspora sp. GP83 TaxID=3156264 RepID=UPI003517731B
MRFEGSPRCPDCGEPLTGPIGPGAACPACALPLGGPVAAELWQVDVALADLRTREAQLLARREELLATLRAARAETASPPPPGESALPAAPIPVQERPKDISAKAVQNLLLGLGGTLLVVAAIVFTVVSWGHLGIGGRAAILLGFTTLVLAAPVFLRTRGLAATAETLSMLGLALLFLDGYAAWQVGVAGLDGIDPQNYTAGLIAVVAVSSGAYGRFSRLRLPVPVAIVLAQFPLTVLAFDRHVLWLLWALIATAAADAAAWVLWRRTTLAICFGIVWSLGAAAGVLESLETHDLPGALKVCGVLVVAVALALFIAVRAAKPWSPALAAASSVTLIAALAPPVRVVLESRWTGVPGPAAALVVAVLAVLASCAASGLGTPVSGTASAGVPRAGSAFRAVASAVATTAVITAGLTAMPVLAPVMNALVGPLRYLGVWEGIRTGGIRDVMLAKGMGAGGMDPAGTAAEWVVAGPELVVLAVFALACAVVTLLPLPGQPVERQDGKPDQADQPVQWRKVLLAVAFALGVVTVAVCPVALNLPYAAAIAVQLVLAASLAAISTRATVSARAAAVGVLALAAAMEACAWALVSEPATLIVLGVLAVTAAVTALAALMPAAVRTGSAATVVRTGSAATATLLAGSEAVAAWLAADLDSRFVTFVLLGVACVAGVVAPLLKTGPRVAVEISGYVLGLAGLLLVPDLRMFSLACAVAGVLGLGTALLKDRRVAGYVGTGFLLSASWTRLFADGVDVVEAYTVPFSLVLLVIGWLRARESSWLSYGSGLAFSLGPSLLVVYAQPEGWIRPLTLGLASLAILLAGGRFRLQAPAVLGGFTLAAVAVHELAPWITQLVTAVPRWVPMAAGGLVLLLVGATYEARLKDIRRIRDGIRALH